MCVLFSIVSSCVFSPSFSAETNHPWPEASFDKQLKDCTNNVDAVLSRKKFASSVMKSREGEGPGSYSGSGRGKKRVWNWGETVDQNQAGYTFFWTPVRAGRKWEMKIHEAMILWILMPEKIKWNLQPIRMSTNSVPKSPVKIGYENMFLWEKQLLTKTRFFFWGGGSLPKIETCWRLSKKEASIFLDFLKIFGTWTPVWTFGVVGYDMYNVYIYILYL